MLSLTLVPPISVGSFTYLSVYLLLAPICIPLLQLDYFNILDGLFIHSHPLVVLTFLSSPLTPAHLVSQTMSLSSSLSLTPPSPFPLQSFSRPSHTPFTFRVPLFFQFTHFFSPSHLSHLSHALHSLSSFLSLSFLSPPFLNLSLIQALSIYLPISHQFPV